MIIDFQTLPLMPDAFARTVTDADAHLPAGYRVFVGGVSPVFRDRLLHPDVEQLLTVQDVLHCPCCAHFRAVDCLDTIWVCALLCVNLALNHQGMWHPDPAQRFNIDQVFGSNFMHRARPYVCRSFSHSRQVLTFPSTLFDSISSVRTRFARIWEQFSGSISTEHGESARSSAGLACGCRSPSRF